MTKSSKKELIENWGPRMAARITRVRVDLDMWDDEPEILDWFMVSDRRENRASAVDLLLGDVLHSIGRMSPAELKAFIVGIYARRQAYLKDAEDAAALKGRAA